MTTYEKELFTLKEKQNNELAALRKKFKKKKPTRETKQHYHEWKILYREPVSGLCHEECVICREYRSI